jgi:hypothetical protein
MNTILDINRLFKVKLVANCSISNSLIFTVFFFCYSFIIAKKIDSACLNIFIIIIYHSL